MFDRKVIVSCPYDSTHRFEESRLPYHLMRCRKNQLNLRKIRCPYNVWHLVTDVEFKDHIEHCPSSSIVKNLEYRSEALQELGTVSLKTTKNLPIVKMEDWKEENVCTYDPWKSTESRDVIRSLIGGTKSQKKKFREYEQKRLANLADEKMWSQSLGQQFKNLRINKVSPKVLNLAHLMKNLERLHLDDMDAIIDSINLEKLVISKIKYRSALINGKPIPKIIEEVLTKELKKILLIA